VVGLKACFLQDLHDAPSSSDPRPWVSLPPSFPLNGHGMAPIESSLSDVQSEALPRQSVDSIGQRGEAATDCLEQEGIGAPPESSEVAEIALLHNLLRDLVNKFVILSSPLLVSFLVW
jgi:hypothetical protein